jgi:hypothetical protein
VNVALPADRRSVAEPGRNLLEPAAPVPVKPSRTADMLGQELGGHFTLPWRRVGS